MSTTISQASHCTNTSAEEVYVLESWKKMEGRRQGKVGKRGRQLVGGFNPFEKY